MWETTSMISMSFQLFPFFLMFFQWSFHVFLKFLPCPDLPGWSPRETTNRGRSVGWPFFGHLGHVPAVSLCDLDPNWPENLGNLRMNNFLKILKLNREHHRWSDSNHRSEQKMYCSSSRFALAETRTIFWWLFWGWQGEHFTGSVRLEEDISWE